MRSLLGLFLLLPVLAAAAPDRHDSVRFDASRFEQQRAELQRAIQVGARYAELSDKGRAEVLAGLDEIAELLAEHGSAATMPEADKVRLLNAQELVNTRLTRAADDSRLICRREQQSGSHLRRSVCMTVAERRRAREGVREAMRHAGRTQSQQKEWAYWMNKNKAR